MSLLFGLRFDFRNPAMAATTMADRYAAALEMAEWAERHGALAISVAEHHASPDGYIPSPLVMVAAMAARTATVRLSVAALIAPFYDPIRLAEDMLVLDHLSRGRVDLVIGGGYVDAEFELYGVDPARRAGHVTEVVRALKGAFSGSPFEYRGRTVELTPPPFRDGGLAVLLGGSSEGAARRAARIADGFVPTVPEVWEFYRDEVQRLGRPDPGPALMGPMRTVALAEDPDKAWADMGPYFLHENNAYGGWQAASGIESPYHTVADVGTLRARGDYAIVTPAEFVEELKAARAAFPFLHPLVGGMPIDLAWSSLQLFEDHVLPAFP